MLSQAETLNWETVNKEYYSNEARGIELYSKKNYKYTAKVIRIEKDSCDITDVFTTRKDEKTGIIYEVPVNTIDCYLPKDELVKLKEGDTITVVGKLYLSAFPKLKPAYLIEIKENADG